MNLQNDTKWEDVQLNVFDTLRFPLVVLVIFIHCRGIDSSVIDFKGNEGFLFYNCLRFYLSGIVSQISVPLFFFISGYLFFISGWTLPYVVYCQKLKRRCKTLLIPYVLWIIIFLIFSLVLDMIPRLPLSFSEAVDMIGNLIESNGYFRLFYDSRILGCSISLIHGLHVDNTAPLLFTLWFVRDLMIVVLLAPLIAWLLRNVKVFFVIMLAILHIFNIWPNIHGFSSVALFYFSMGAYFAGQKEQLDKLLHTCGSAMVVLALALSFACLWLNGKPCAAACGVMLQLFTIVGCFSALFLGHCSVKSAIARKMCKLSKYTFFVYAAHMVFVNRYCSIWVRYVFPKDTLFCLVMHYLLSVVVIVLVCLALYEIIKRICPYGIRLLCGGR